MVGGRYPALCKKALAEPLLVMSLGACRTPTGRPRGEPGYMTPIGAAVPDHQLPQTVIDHPRLRPRHHAGTVEHS